MRTIVYILLLLTASIGPAWLTPARAQPVYQVDQPTGSAQSRAAPSGAAFSLDGYLATDEDTTGRVTIREAVARHRQGRYVTLPKSQFNSGYTASNHWLHLTLRSQTARTVFLELNNPRINQLWFYELAGDSLLRAVRTGDLLPFRSRVFPSYNWVFPITLNGKTAIDIYVMAAKRHEVLGLQVRLWESSRFSEKDRAHYLFWGLFAGFGSVILLINLTALIATRDFVYGWFIALALAIGLHIAAQSGLGFQYLWPDNPAFNYLDPQVISGWLIMVTQLQFMQWFIGQHARNSRAFYGVQAFKYTVLSALLVNILLRVADVFPVAHFRWTFTLTLVFIVVGIGLALWSILERIRQRENVVLFYTITFMIQLVGFVSVFFFTLAFTQKNGSLFVVDSYWVIVVNFLFDLILLSSGLLYFWFSNYRRQNEALLVALHQTEQAQSQRIIDALEIERGRIAEDLYDDVGAMLSTAIGFVSGVTRKAGVSQQFPTLVEARSLLDRAVDNLRTVSHNLMPKNFAQLGLSKSLAETIDKVASANPVRFSYIVAGEVRKLDTTTEVQIFRIGAELINAVLKDSAATEATFQLIYNNDHLSLIVEDDGPETPVHSTLQSKVDFIAGSLTIDTSPGGTTAIVEIPYP